MNRFIVFLSIFITTSSFAVENLDCDNLDFNYSGLSISIISEDQILVKRKGWKKDPGGKLSKGDTIFEFRSQHQRAKHRLKKVLQNSILIDYYVSSDLRSLGGELIECKGEKIITPS